MYNFNILCDFEKWQAATPSVDRPWLLYFFNSSVPTTLNWVATYVLSSMKGTVGTLEQVGCREMGHSRHPLVITLLPISSYEQKYSVFGTVSVPSETGSEVRHSLTSPKGRLDSLALTFASKQNVSQGHVTEQRIPDRQDCRWAPLWAQSKGLDNVLHA